MAKSVLVGESKTELYLKNGKEWSFLHSSGNREEIYPLKAKYFLIDTQNWDALKEFFPKKTEEVEK